VQLFNVQDIDYEGLNGRKAWGVEEKPSTASVTSGITAIFDGMARQAWRLAPWRFTACKNFP
jgi:hypothetical protein